MESLHPLIEVRGFKYPRRPTSVAHAFLLGEDRFGRWLGIAKGSTWRSADHTHSGEFIESFVKFIPYDTFWSACFRPSDPSIDVDIILPVNWRETIVEEVDLELDILCNASGEVWVRDEEKFAHVRHVWNMPETIAQQALITCEQVRVLVEQKVDPFGRVGMSWLADFLSSMNTPESVFEYDLTRSKCG